ncbi:3-phenylpropionate/cinnamic acid dioxygenase subunit beta [Nocardia sp. NPDC052112]|uniref:aromatic-ring-hydroxylating dioxygenase subunit beta n=1 Tax=Nocardia sp. NPDC052112 TaxID=3155646 RepID=UPI003427CB1A
MITTTANDRDVQYEVEQFLYREARLLDEWQWPHWLALFEDDVRYWCPLRTNRPRREIAKERSSYGELSHFDDDRHSLEVRVDRLGTGMAWSEEPPSRTRHLITNVVVDEVLATQPTELAVTSNFLLYRTNSETSTDIWAGSRQDRLRRRDDGSFGIAGRTIVLDQAVLTSKNLSVMF